MYTFYQFYAPVFSEFVRNPGLWSLQPSFRHSSNHNQQSISLAHKTLISNPPAKCSLPPAQTNQGISQNRVAPQGTWVHPEIAIDLARWVSVSFRIWANRTLMAVMLASEIEVVQEQTPQNLAPSHEAAQLALLLGEFAFLRKISHRAVSH